MSRLTYVVLNYKSNILQAVVQGTCIGNHRNKLPRKFQFCMYKYLQLYLQYCKKRKRTVALIGATEFNEVDSGVLIYFFTSIKPVNLDQLIRLSKTKLFLSFFFFQRWLFGANLQKTSYVGTFLMSSVRLIVFNVVFDEKGIFRQITSVFCATMLTILFQLLIIRCLIR